MAENSDFNAKLDAALDARYHFLAASEIPKLKDALRSFQIAYSALYSTLVRKGILIEDPYKNESKIQDLTMPETGDLNDADKQQQFSLRLANFDNHLDFLVNFFALSIDSLTIDKIKILLETVKFIDWMHPSQDSSSANTAFFAGIITKERRNPGDVFSAKTFNDSLSRLDELSATLFRLLKEFSDYNRELYKSEVRKAIIADLQEKTATIQNIKKLFPKSLPGKRFYTELIQEAIAEEFSPERDNLQKAILSKLYVAEEKKPEKKVEEENFRSYLTDGLNVLGSTGTTLQEILEKIDLNHSLIQNQKKSFGERVKEILSKMFNSETEPVIYNINTVDPSRGPLKEKIDYNKMYEEIERKIRVLTALRTNGSAATKINAMQDDQVLELLEKNIHDIVQLHRQLAGLDDFFKTEVPPADRNKVRGIKPELSTIKNAFAKAGGKRADYIAVIEEKAQFKKLGLG